MGRLIGGGFGILIRTVVGFLVGGEGGNEVGWFISEEVRKLVGDGVGDLVASRVRTLVGMCSSGRGICLPLQLQKATCLSI